MTGRFILRRPGWLAVAAAPVLLLAASPSVAAQPGTSSPDAQSSAGQEQSMDMPGMPGMPGMPATSPAATDMPGMPGMQSTKRAPVDMGATQGAKPAPMEMGAMEGGRPPADARDPNAYADGYRNSTLPGFEKADQLPVSFLLADQLEFLSGNEGQGFSWSGQFARGPDNDKLWLRTQGLKVSGQRLDPETGAEALWWHGYSPFWGRTLGVRQDFGRGAHTWLAFGIEGLAPYWFKLELTGYVSDAANVGARVKASYDVLLTNRLIATPSVETNVYTKKQSDRGLGSGVSNVELGLRLRYEIRRKFAPYVGLVWERSFGGTADFNRRDGEQVTERRFVAGLRLWF